MKKILYIIGVLLALASCTEEDAAVQPQEMTTQTFSVAISEPDYAPQTRLSVTMNRYLLEMYESNLSATPDKYESTYGTFSVAMKKGVDYICLFWADDGAEDYDATNLQAVKQATATKPGKEAYYTCVTLNSNNLPSRWIVLRRAVAELSFINTKELTEADNTLKITYPSAVMNLGTGTVVYRTGSPVVHTLTGITPPASSADPFAADFILAPAEAGKLTGLKLQLNSGEEKTIPEAAVQANYQTRITGEY